MFHHLFSMTWIPTVEVVRWRTIFAHRSGKPLVEDWGMAANFAGKCSPNMANVPNRGGIWQKFHLKNKPVSRALYSRVDCKMVGTQYRTR